MNKIINKDCLEALKELPDNSVDSIVTDPPYGLSFMGKKWDYDVPSTEIWSECLRVLKPGGYLLAFAGTRTYHRMAVRIEDAGFEIRDMIAWIYGSGFPKSLNIGKAVDKLQGNEREEYVHKYASRRVNSIDTNAGHEYGFDTTKKTDTKGNSPWEGWGTALKPALEPITVARKPISEKTVAENCLKWGVGGINIDGSRVEGEKTRLNGRSKQSDENNTIFTGYGSQEKGEKNYGRFPANLIHDGSEEVLELFPETSHAGNTKSSPASEGMFGVGRKDFRNTYGNDGSSAARFFYCAKASAKERNMGEIKSTHPTMKPIKLMEYLVNLVSKEGHTVLDPFSGSGTTGIACKKLNRNFIGIERDEEYCKIATARIESVSQNNTLFV